MKHLMVILVAVGIAGCNNDTTPEKYKAASELCVANGGLTAFKLYRFGGMKVHCKNGAVFLPEVEEWGE